MAETFLLVVPFGVVNPRTGAGHRTTLMYEAQRAFGPTHVAMMSSASGTDWNVFFPGAAGAHTIPVPAFKPYRPSPGARALRMARRLFWPDGEFSERRWVGEALERLVSSARVTCVVYRFTPPATVSGQARFPSGRVVEVCDVDDREDRRYTAFLTSKFGKGWVRRWPIANAAARLEAQLRDGLRRMSLVWFAKEDDLLDLDGPSVRLLPNVAFVTPGTGETAPPSAARGLLFVGTAEHSPNREGICWFLDNVWPIIRKSEPAAEIRVVGLGPWSEVQKRYTGVPGVRFVGKVDDLAPEYDHARAVIVPIFMGAGSQLKLVEACAFGRAIVSSSMSSTGFGSKVAANLAVADSPDEFARACLSYLRDGAAADRAGAAPQAAQRKLFSKESMVARVTADVREALAMRHEHTAGALLAASDSKERPK